jgi:hypothetical protein
VLQYVDLQDLIYKAKVVKILLDNKGNNPSESKEESKTEPVHESPSKQPLDEIQENSENQPRSVKLPTTKKMNSPLASRNIKQIKTDIYAQTTQEAGDDFNTEVQTSKVSISQIWSEPPKVFFPEWLIALLPLEKLYNDTIEKSETLKERIEKRKDEETRKKQEK